jgi:hypothetical protein
LFFSRCSSSLSWSSSSSDPPATDSSSSSLFSASWPCQQTRQGGFSHCQTFRSTRHK